MTNQPPTCRPKPEGHRWIIAIDGPAASGKGTLSRKIAKTLGFAHLDTGALYRATALLHLEQNRTPEQAAIELQNILHNENPGVNPLNNPELKNDDVGQAASKLAAIPEVRKILLDLQKNFAAHPPAPAKGAVLDGRDIGTIICPNADAKLFITASTETRAKRRFEELSAKPLQSAPNPATYEAVLKDMRERDARDQGRKTAPMVPADDALIIDTSHLTIEEAYGKAMELILDRIPAS